MSESVPYDGLSRECSYVENELNKKFGAYKNHIDKLLSGSL